MRMRREKVADSITFKANFEKPSVLFLSCNLDGSNRLRQRYNLVRVHRTAYHAQSIRWTPRYPSDNACMLRTQRRIAARLAPAKSEWFFSLRVKESMRELSMFGIVGEEKR